jgi:hypothetical protein
MLVRRAALAGAGSLTLLGAVVGLSAVPASAAHVPHAARAARPNPSPRVDSHGCAGHNWCMYTLPGYAGTQYSFDYNNNAHDTWIYVGNNQNDVAQAMDNNREFITAVSKNSPVNAQWACSTGAASDLANYSWPNGTTANQSISAFLMRSSATGVCGEDIP